jgi:hypothetical protein
MAREQIDEQVLSVFRSRSGKDLPRYAKSTLEYFEWLSEHGRPEEPHWKLGASIVRRWILLIDSKQVTQEQLDELLAEMRAEEQVGSMFCDLYRRIRDWGIAVGLSVDEGDFPSGW